jgi:hypothetical protein
MANGRVYFRADLDPVALLNLKGVTLMILVFGVCICPFTVAIISGCLYNIIILYLRGGLRLYYNYSTSDIHQTSAGAPPLNRNYLKSYRTAAKAYVKGQGQVIYYTYTVQYCTGTEQQGPYNIILYFTCTCTR